MINGILGKKLGMTQIYNSEGEVIPVTVVEAGPCVVLQVKGKEKDGYNSIQLGFDTVKESRVNKPQLGRFKKAGCACKRFIKEIKVDTVEGIKPNDTVSVEIFSSGEYVDISGNSIGKGFQGGMKRHNWTGGPESHGSMSHRAIGSVGATDAARIVKGHPMAGHMGSAKVISEGLEIIDVDKDNNLMIVKGAVPGHKGNYLVINKSRKKQKKQPKPKVDPSQQKALNPLKKSKRSMGK